MSPCPGLSGDLFIYNCSRCIHDAVLESKRFEPAQRLIRVRLGLDGNRVRKKGPGDTGAGLKIIVHVEDRVIGQRNPGRRLEIEAKIKREYSCRRYAV